VAGVVARNSKAAHAVEEAWQVTAYTSVDALLRAAPEYVVVAVPRTANPGVVTAITRAGVPVLCETPPASDLEGLCQLWSAVGDGNLVQVAEQYLLYPGHVARRAVLASGALGTPTSVQVSSTHLYHAASMIRGILGVGFQDAIVRANVFRGPLVNPLTRSGWTGDDAEHQATTTLATIEFSGGGMGAYDFTDNQWHNPLRSRRIVIRASRGEIVDDRVVRLVDAQTVVESSIVRRQTGWDLNLEGFHLDHLSHEGVVLYRNPFPEVSLSDEEIAVATLLTQVASWTLGEAPGPYPLAAACQDHAIGLAIQAAADSGEPVVVSDTPWAN
jgi:predicted dehydrogenase